MSDQISKPVLAALVLTVVLGGLWFAVLRGGDEPVADAPPPTAPAVAAAAPGVPAPAAPGAPAPAPAEPAREVAADGAGARRAARVLAQLERGRTVVLLFWNGSSSDDRAARRAVEGVGRRDGKVQVVVERLSRLGDYGQITNGVRVAQSPTTLVIDRRRQVQAIVGYTVTSEVEQAIADARGRGD